MTGKRVSGPKDKAIAYEPSACFRGAKAPVKLEAYIGLNIDERNAGLASVCSDCGLPVEMVDVCIFTARGFGHGHESGPDKELYFGRFSGVDHQDPIVDFLP